ncbi:hypothetical protein BDP27DRAFT_58782 [Rhodocollybia butyracea]|uniref:Uncharacterized protein n=1 Tax=Rhodocollybia butyracea TaxID=206335 RepID=A0A9P5PGS5_9AGAR|nr:hypothetical protein BDP27DRAFT_58782 [Rhodocollybia butyracea]
MMCGIHVCAGCNEGQNLLSYNEPVPQLIAEVISAVMENNRPRQRLLPQQTIPAITMVSSLSTRQVSSQPTIVQRLVPPFADKEAYIVHGKIPLADRRVVFRCLKAMGTSLLNYSVPCISESRFLC